LTRTLHRIVRSDPPTLLDFTSNAALGRVLRNPTPELLDRWSGLSAYDTEEQARHRARWAADRRRWLGDFIAVLEVGSEIRVEQTFEPGHYTVWGEPEALLSYTVRVVPV
jgi:hypothetical protein